MGSTYNYNATTLDQLTDNEDGTTSFLKCVKCDLFELYYNSCGQWLYSL